MGNREVVTKVSKMPDPVRPFVSPYAPSGPSRACNLRSELSNVRTSASQEYQNGQITFSSALTKLVSEIERLKKEGHDVSHAASWQLGELSLLAQNQMEKDLVATHLKVYSQKLDSQTLEKLENKYGAISSASNSVEPLPIQKPDSSLIIQSNHDPEVSSSISSADSLLASDSISPWVHLDSPQTSSSDFQKTIIGPSIAAVMFLVEKASDLVDLLAGQKPPRAEKESEPKTESTVVLDPVSPVQVSPPVLKNEFSSVDSKIEPMTESPLIVATDSTSIVLEKPTSAFYQSESVPILSESLINTSIPSDSVSTNVPDTQSLLKIRSKKNTSDPQISPQIEIETVSPKKLGFLKVFSSKDSNVSALSDSAPSPSAPSKKIRSKRILQTKKISKSRSQILSAKSIPHSTNDHLKTSKVKLKVTPPKVSTILVPKLSKNKNAKVLPSPSVVSSNSKLKTSKPKPLPVSISQAKPPQLKKSKKDLETSVIESKIKKTSKTISKKLKKEQKTDKTILEIQKEKFRQKIALLLSKAQKSKKSSKFSKKRSK